jgi:tetratricopeptide (TPR) repeat protein
MSTRALAHRFLRAVLIVGVGAAAIVGASAIGPGAGVAAFTLIVLGLFAFVVLLPRAAHRAFERGDFDRAARLYRILRPFVVDPGIRGALDVSLAGCRLAGADWRGALAELERVPGDALAPSARAAWLNNRAYANARGPIDAAAALRDAEAAMALRPDVAGFRHTRGIALLALGRTDDAIHELDTVWRKLAHEELPPLLEAERCFDLGHAWLKKGEPDYARDYFQRARAVAPVSPWARAAGEAMARLPLAADRALAEEAG